MSTAPRSCDRPSQEKQRMFQTFLARMRRQTLQLNPPTDKPRSRNRRPSDDFMNEENFGRSNLTGTLHVTRDDQADQSRQTHRECDHVMHDAGNRRDGPVLNLGC